MRDPLSREQLTAKRDQAEHDVRICKLRGDADALQTARKRLRLYSARLERLDQKESPAGGGTPDQGKCKLTTSIIPDSGEDCKGGDEP